METTASKTSPRPFHALIVAAGKGTRLGGPVPKQYHRLGGITILRRTVDVFLGCPGLRSLRIVCAPEHESLCRESGNDLDLREPVHGGPTRNESVYNGLLSFHDLDDKDMILIHDAARPFVTQADILAVVEALNSNKAATLAVPVSDTMRRASRSKAGDFIDRTDAWAIQTPQGFHYGTIRKAHEKGRHLEATDDTALVSALGVPVKLVSGHRRNFKITTPEDMELAESMIREETRTGSGFDVHAFTEGQILRLCGIDVPFSKSLAGHSDADVALHALTDALLGTIASGDIGSHFPPSDPRWRGVDSAIFLKEAQRLLESKGGRIIHADITIICEAPKIGPHRAAMQDRLASLLDLPSDRVSVKATTTEGLGFTGRGEGIAAQATVSCAFQMNRT